MVNPKSLKNLKAPQKGEVRNPRGNHKRTKHISHWIDELLHDPKFSAWLEHPKEGVKKFEGPPIEAIIITAMKKAATGDPAAREWLAKYGYGSKVDIKVSVNPVEQILDKFGLGEADMDAGQDKEA